MLTYDLTDCGNLPLYEALYTSIQHDIQEQIIRPGDRLPSKRSLARHLGISVTTVEGAYRRLLEEGYIRSRPSSGYYVEAPQHVPQPDSYSAYYSSPYSPNVTPAPTESMRVSTDQVPTNTLLAPLRSTSPSSQNYASAPTTDPQPEEFQMDFKGNRCSLSLFPMSVWTKAMRQILSNPDPELLDTIPYNGLLSLRQAIADYLRRSRRMKVDPNQIVIAAGTEYLYERLMYLFSRNAVVAFGDPGYKKLAQVCTRTGVGHQFVPIDAQGMDVNYLAASSASIAHLSPSNHFPTGVSMSKRRREEILAWAYADPFRFIIEDEYDSEFATTGHQHKTLFSTDNDNRVVYMNTFSKVLVPSLRISYMILPQSLMPLYRNSMSFYACTASGFEQQTLAHFIEDGSFERHLNRLRTYYAKKRQQLQGVLEASEVAKVISFTHTGSGTHLIVHVATHMTDAEIHQAAHALGTKISMLSDYCYRPRHADMNTLVINFAGMEEDDYMKVAHVLEQLFLPAE